MNPAKPTATIPVKPSVTAGADKILAVAKRVTEMPDHVVVAPQVKQPQAKQLDEPNAKFDVHAFIAQFEQDALLKKFGHLGTGGYDKLLIEKIRENMDFIPERDKEVHSLISQSVTRFDLQTRGRA